MWTHNSVVAALRVRVIPTAGTASRRACWVMACAIRASGASAVDDGLVDQVTVATFVVVHEMKDSVAHRACD